MNGRPPRPAGGPVPPGGLDGLDGAALREARYHAAIYGSQDAFFLLEALRDPAGRLLDFRYLEANPAALRSIGRVEDVAGLRRAEVARPAAFDPFSEVFTRVLDTGETFKGELRLPPDPSLVVRWVRLQVVKVGDGLAVTFADITERVETRLALEASEARFRTVMEESPVGLAIVGLDGRWLQVNRALCAILARTAEDLVGRHVLDLTHPEDVAADREALVRLASGAVSRCEVVKRYRRPDGSSVWVQVHSALVRDPDGRPRHYLSHTLDVTERRARDEALRETLEELRRREHESARLAALVESSPDAILSVSPEGTVLTWNPGAERLYGYSAAEMVGASIERIFRPGAVRETDRQVLRRVAAGETLNAHPAERVRKDGTRVPVNLSAAPVRDAQGRVIAISIVAHDMTERHRLFREVQDLALRDPLTRLPNRTLLHERLQEAVNLARERRERLAVAFLDLDRFKDLNDSFGHEVGDAILQEVAARLSASVREGDTLARVSGDEFCAVFQPLHATRDATALARRLLSAFDTPVTLGSRVFTVTGSIGLAVYPNDGRDPDALLRAADRAMYAAKRGGRQAWSLHTRRLSKTIEARLAIEAELRPALERGELDLHYQKIVTLDGTLTAFEALLRWTNPRLGPVSPVDFIPVAEEHGLIEAIGDWVLDEACRQQAAWLAAGRTMVPLDVNLSPAQFGGRPLVRSIADKLARHGLEPRHLGLELTESLLMKDPAASIRQLADLRALGVHLSIDDFGTGYSSLSYLHRLPMHTVKVDRSLIAEIGRPGGTRPLVAAAVTMAREFGLDVVAEGVETTEQAQILRELGCARAQGWLYGKPQPPEEL